jgi:hypothetical protein
MHIKTEKGLEVDLSPEELRHFKIKDSRSLKSFVSELANEEKIKIGFTSNDK